MKGIWPSRPKKKSAVGNGHLRVAAVQFRSDADLTRNAASMIAALAQCAKHGVQVAVFPECSLTSYHADAILGLTAETITAAEMELARGCRRLRIAALIGTAENINDGWLNAAVIIDRNGRIKTRYYKEYLVGSDRAWRCASGNRAPPVFSISRIKASTIICHDNRYPE